MVKPLMRELYAKGALTDPAAELMKPPPPELLYDTEADPYEINNLAESDEPEHKEALIRLRASLNTWDETGDLGAIPELPEVYEPFEKEMDKWFGTPDWY